ncbi:MAG: pyridoxal 5'-phosphate synthase glutaminase subunit PdxT [Chloroflexota bacterium]
MTTIGVLALQGDFLEHAAMLKRLRVEPREVRTAEQLKGLDGLIIPGGESTTFGRLIEDFRLHEPLAAFVRSGTPTWGTCAGMIVLANHASDLPFPTLQAIDIEVDRNAYGRQVDSFEADIDIPAIGAEPYHAIFIRAPVVASVGEGVEVLATCKRDDDDAEKPVAVRQGNIMATSFHPELTEDPRLHRYFLDIVDQVKRPSSAK